MNSKEALEQLRKYNGIGLCGDETLFEPIEKDLEVLDQLSNILSADYLFRVFNYETAKEIRDYLKSNELVKEWLEDGKQ